MGKVLSVLSKPVRNFNIENRAHKVISKEKPIPAPKHKINLDEYQSVLKDSEALREIQSKHEALDKRLKNIYVMSHDPEHNHLKTSNPDRPLPMSRNNVDDFEYGYNEPTKIAPGRTTLRHALKFINDHQTNPQIQTISKISDEYLLSEETVSNLLKYYKVFEVYLPEQHQVKATFYGPKVRRRIIEIRKSNKIADGTVDKKNT